MKQTLSLNTKQTLSMTPQLQQAIRLLQLSAADLDLEIKAALESNPLLEATDDLSVDTVWEDVETDYNAATTTSNEFTSAENYTSAVTSLQDYLLWQLNLITCTEQERIIALSIIDAIDDSGYLRTPLTDLCSEFANIELATIEAVLHKVQQFDPCGVASRNLQECLLLQLNALPLTKQHLKQCTLLVTKYLDLLGAKNYAKIRSNMHLSEAELQAIIHTLTQLHPHPGETITTHADEYIVPDVNVSHENGRWVVRLNNNLATTIRINPKYASLVKRADSSRDNQFIRDQLTEAKWFLNSLKTRNETLLKVATCIVKQQLAFLEHGEEQMQPMILQDIAQAVDLNESTISRITTNKYINTPRGIYELKYFFSSHVSNSQGNHCSSTAIKAIIKQLIGAETTEHRLSDQEITDILLQRGINIARRTVTKYRESLNIQSSNQRK